MKDIPITSSNYKEEEINGQKLNHVSSIIKEKGWQFQQEKKVPDKKAKLESLTRSK